MKSFLKNKWLVWLLSFYAANALAQAPANDNFTNRITLTGSSISNFVSNIGATREANEPQHSSLPSNSSIWYSWQASSAGGVEIDANSGDFSLSSPILAVYTGNTLATLTRVASNAPPPNGNALANSRLIFTAVASQTYQIAVDGCSTNFDLGQGTLSLLLKTYPPPANDLFANASNIQGTFLETRGSFIGANRELGEPSHGNTNLQQTLWWIWMAPTNLGVAAIPMRITADGVSFPPGLGVYVGNSVSQLTNVISSQQTNVLGTNGVYTNGMTSMATFTAIPGTVYHIALAGRENDDSTTITNFGNYRLRLNSRILSVGITNLNTSTSCSTCSVTFAANTPIQNLGPNASNPLRVYLSAMSGASLRGSGATFEPIPTNKLFLASTPTVVLAPGQTNIATVAGTIPAPTADQGNSVGEGWGAYAELQEQPPLSTNWFTVDEVLVTFGNWPNFNGVSGPGGGAIRLDPDYVGLSADNPLMSVVIVGPSSVPQGRSTNYFGKATYTLGDTYTFTQTVWTASLFTITNGVFTAGSVSSNTIVTLSAAYTNDGFRFVATTNITIPGPPKFTTFKLTNNAFLLTLSGNSNTSYRIEAATNLSPPSNTFWLPLMTNTLTNTIWNYTDLSRTNFPQRFYRAREL